MPLFQPSGGLGYHLRAWRYRRCLWQPFHAQVAHWLTAWQPPVTHLVLVGPSGGYALNPAFLQRFERLTLLEPDGLARFIIARRFPGLACTVHADTGLAGPQGFRWLARTFPDAGLLFCNLLGQTLEGQGPGFDRAAWLADLAPALTGRSWASWHDVASTQRPPDCVQPLRLSQDEGLDKVLAHFWQGGELAIHDHECASLAPCLAREYALWRLTPRDVHVVEWVRAG